MDRSKWPKKFVTIIFMAEAQPRKCKIMPNESISMDKVFDVDYLHKRYKDMYDRFPGVCCYIFLCNPEPNVRFPRWHKYLRNKGIDVDTRFKFIDE